MPRRPPVERLALVEEDLRHHPVDAPADDEVDPRLLVVAVPDGRHLPVDRRIDPVELLELVEHDGERRLLRRLHHVREQVGEPRRRPEDAQVQDALGLLLELRAERLFRLARHRQVQIRRLPVVQRAAEQGGLPDAAAPRHHREPRARPRGLADLPQQPDFLRSSEKVHVASRFSTDFKTFVFKMIVLKMVISVTGAESTATTTEMQGQKSFPRIPLFRSIRRDVLVKSSPFFGTPLRIAVPARDPPPGTPPSHD